MSDPAKRLEKQILQTMYSQITRNLENAHEAAKQMADGVEHAFNLIEIELNDAHRQALRMMYKMALMVPTMDDGVAIRNHLTNGLITHIQEWGRVIEPITHNMMYIWPDICHLCERWSLLSSGTGCCEQCDRDP